MDKKKLMNKIRQKMYSPKKNKITEENISEIISEIDECIKKGIETLNIKKTRR